MAIWRWSESLAVVLAIAALSSAHAQSLDELLAAIDPSTEPSVMYFSEPLPTEPLAWFEHLRWSVGSSIGYDYAGTASVSASASITLPFEAITMADARSTRAGVESELAALELQAAIRDLHFATLDLSCRWGYLRAVEPALAALAAEGTSDARLWSIRRESVERERTALDSQLAATAPGVRRLLRPSAGFLCRLPPLPEAPGTDGLDGHPSLRRLALESAREAYQIAAFTATGGPEVTLDGSIRHSGYAAGVEADVRLAARIPFSFPRAYGSLSTEADPRGARIGVQLDASNVPERSAPAQRLALRLERERAALQLQVAAAVGTYQMLRAQDDLVWDELAQIGEPLPSACGFLCEVPSPTAAGPERRTLWLDAMGLGYDLVRAQLDLMRVLAADPTEWLRTSP